MSGKEQILESLNSEIEKKLYIIKENNFICDEEFIKTYGFEFVKSNFLNSIVINIGKNIYRFKKGYRLIDFIIEGKSHKRFIYSSEYLKSVLKELKIDCYSLKEDITNTSWNSEISLEEILNIFNDVNITTIYKINTSIDKIIDKFKSRFPEEIKKISDLSLNAEFYFPENCNDALDTDIFLEENNQNIEIDIERNIWNDNMIYFIGSKGTSKSIFLMYFFLFTSKISFYPLLYINYRKIAHLDLKERKNIFKKELLYLFFEEETLRDFLKNKYYKIIKKEKDFILALKIFLQDLINIYENTFKERIIVIIDNFDEENEQEYEKMESLIRLVKQNEKKIKLILSGHCQFINKKIKSFLFGTNKEKGEIIINYNVTKGNTIKIKNSPPFYFKNNINDSKLEQVLLEKEIEYCKKFNIYGMYNSIINCDKKIEIKELDDYFCLLPIEYLFFEKKENNSITFTFHNPLFQKAIKKTINNLIKEQSYDFLLKEGSEKKLLKAIFEEKLLTSLISYNKLNLENWKVNEKNLLEVEKIADFKYSKYSKTKNNLENGLPIVITQKEFTGEHYDLLILFPNKGINDTIYYIAYMIQIGLNKTDIQIEKIRNDFDDNFLNYKDGINKFVANDIRVRQLELLFIFDKSTQDNYIQGNTSSDKVGSKYCIKNNIKFYLFSAPENCLLITFDNHNFLPVSQFGKFNKPFKRKWNVQNIFPSIIYEEEINFINNKLGLDIMEYEFIVKSNAKVPEIIDEDIVYVLKNEEEKDAYYIINNQIYNKNFEKIKKINEDTLFFCIEFSKYSKLKTKIKINKKLFLK